MFAKHVYEIPGVRYFRYTTPEIRDLKIICFQYPPKNVSLIVRQDCRHMTVMTLAVWLGTCQPLLVILSTNTNV